MARLFNGSTDYIASPTVAGALAASVVSRTVVGWVNPSALPASYTGLFGLYNDPSFFFRTYLKSNGTLACYIVPGTGVNIDGTGVRVVSVGRWHHLAFTVDASFLRQYVDGVFDVSAASTGFVLGSSSCPFTIGQDDSSSARFFNGSISDVAVYNASLSATEVSALANGARPPSIRPAALVGYWPLTGKQASEPDYSSGIKNNGALFGTRPAVDPQAIWNRGQFKPWLFGQSAATGFLAGWARGSNLPVIGTGNY